MAFDSNEGIIEEETAFAHLPLEPAPTTLDETPSKLIKLGAEPPKASPSRQELLAARRERGSDGKRETLQFPKPALLMTSTDDRDALRFPMLLASEDDPDSHLSVNLVR